MNNITQDEVLDSEEGFDEIKHRVGHMTPAHPNMEDVVEFRDDGNKVWFFLPGLAIALYPDGHYTTQPDGEA